MNLHHSSNRLPEFQYQLQLILSSLKTVLERKASSKEDAQLIATAYQSAHDLLLVIQDWVSKDNLDKEGDLELEFFKKEIESIVTDLPVEENEELASIYQEFKVLENIKPILDTQSTHELTDADQNWLYQIEHRIERGISNFNFNAETLAGQIYISRRQLDRRIKLLTGFTTSQYIRETTMLKAHQLITGKEIYSIKEVSFKVGIKSVSHFSKQYKSRFGNLPSDLLKGK